MAEKITKELVFKIADRLVMSGRSVTNAQVRAENGNSGSLSSIGPYLKMWKEEANATTDSEVPEMPTDMLLAALNPLWAVLSREAQALFDEERTSFEKKIADLDDEMLLLSGEVDRQGEENAQLTADINRHIEGKQQTDIKLAEQRERINTSQLQRQEDLKLIVELKAQVANHAKREQELSEKLAVSQSHQADLNVSNTGLKEKVINIESLLSSAKRSVEDLENSNESLLGENSELLNKNSGYQDQIEILKSDKQKQSIEISELHVDKKYAKELKKEHQEQVGALTLDKSRLEIANDKLQAALIEQAKLLPAATEK